MAAGFIRAVFQNTQDRGDGRVVTTNREPSRGREIAAAGADHADLVARLGRFRPVSEGPAGMADNVDIHFTAFRMV